MSSHQCHIKSDGSMKCWGNNGSGHLGIGATRHRGDNANEMGPYLPYVNVGKDLKVDQVCTGGTFTCVHLTSNQIKCWGSNGNGQLGLGITNSPIGNSPSTAPDKYNPVDLGTDSYPTYVVCGNTHSCVLFANKKVKCFGYASSGQIGYESSTQKGNAASDMGNNLPFVNLGTNIEVKSIHTHATSDHTCIIIATSQYMKCWGGGGNYRLGYSTNTNRGITAGTMGDSLPTIDLGSEDKVKAVTLGGSFTCALRVDDELKCWGNNSNGQLGLGVSTTPIVNTGSLISTIYDSGKKIKQLASGSNHLCVLYDDNLTVKCIGNNNNGQLGQGDNIKRGDTPTTTLPNIPAIDLGTGTLQISYLKVTDLFTCVIFVDNSIKCFGTGNNGVLGSGAISDIGTSPTHMGTNLAFIDVFSTFAPTKSPTPPTYAPTTKAPTKNPTKSPTRNPIKNPTKSPTKNPTRKPTTYGFFGSQESSLPFGSVKAFDLYLLIDTTKTYNQANFHCKQYKLVSGTFPSSCFDLMIDYAIEIVKSISVATNGYYSNDLSNGLRVQASLIQCVGSSKTPLSTALFTLTGDSSIIMNGLNNARTNTQLTESASCPLQGLYDVIQKIESEWSSVKNRPYKAVITLTDAQVALTSNPGMRLIDVVSGIRYRCTPSIVIVPFRKTDPPDNSANQQLSLMILTGNIDSSVFEAKNAPWIVIPKIGEQITSLLISSNINRCSSSTSFSTADKYWCGYNTRALCSARSSCDFVVGPGCQKKQSQSGCVYGDQTSCESNTQCQWIVSSSSNACTRKPEEPDCNSLVLQSSCNSKSSFCSWNGSGCTTKFIPGPGR